MFVNSSLTPFVNLQEQAYEYMVQRDYDKAVSLYEQAIEVEPETKSHYWYLGLALLLTGKETDAQTTWLVGMMNGEPEQIELWNWELKEVLEVEAQRLIKQNAFSSACLLRHLIKEILPTDINNLLKLILLSIEVERFHGDDLRDLEIIDFLKSEDAEEVEIDLLMKTLQRILDYAPLHPLSLEFAEACLPYLGHSYKYFAVLLISAVNVAYSLDSLKEAIKLAEICLKVNPEDTELLRHLSAFYQKSRNYTKAIETAKKCYSLLEKEAIADKVYGNHLVLKTLINAGGYWQETEEIIQRHRNLLNLLIEQQPSIDDSNQISRVLLSTFFFPYFQDNPQQYRKIQNQLAQLCQNNLQSCAKKKTQWYGKPIQDTPQQLRETERRLKVGYISSCFRQHSVGWLARWLLEYHDRERLELYGYFVGYKQKEDPLQDWYTCQFTTAHKMGIDAREIAERIYQDDLDLLIDLDSLTLDVTCEVMALKPAKIQATWLGWDASGIPAIDYYIADPYVLPDDAQDYYSEKIWRLPQSYIAVDGFEVGVPTLRREHLDIPDRAIVYLSAQGGCKRHPDTVRLQMRILKAVPNSYFLIKGLGKEEAIQSFFTQIADEEGVDKDRLRFLPMVSSEAIHRANLSLADVILDTYPYNGATTTLETLWMRIPLVTRVGEQFAARNSYTMMINAGITEGIAWTDEEYLEWGIRLGIDSELRQKIAWQLQQSRKSAPLWNAEQFAREMEKAYEQMWQIYLNNNYPSDTTRR